MIYLAELLVSEWWLGRNREGWQNMAKPDKLGHQEALHTAYIMTCMWSDFIENHEAVSSNPELKTQAERISEALNDFYQAVARVTVEKFARNVEEP
ncbi:hypothetical protein GEO60473_33440 [Geobacter sp. 60473]|nr:hypothetical protein GEO60473_33440 [Geobacter sp. 60473]